MQQNLQLDIKLEQMDNLLEVLQIKEISEELENSSLLWLIKKV